MSGNHLIFIITPSLSGEKSSHSGFIIESFDILLDFLKTEITNVIGETLIEPQIIPPLHSHEISEPMMS
jgi:hypothetical protein